MRRGPPVRHIETVGAHKSRRERSLPAASFLFGEEDTVSALRAVCVGGYVDAGDGVRAGMGRGQLRAAVILHLHHGIDGMAAVIVQVGILVEQALGILRQIKRGVVAQRLDTQGAADLHHGVKGRTADAVMQRTVDGGQGDVDGESELANALILPCDFRANNFSQIIHK